MTLLEFFDIYMLTIAGLCGLVIIVMLVQAVVDNVQDRRSAKTEQQFRIARNNRRSK